jgi:Collagen triple helix repeat (20 copies)/Chaperone of endosialidase
MSYINPSFAYSGYSGYGAQGAQGAQGTNGSNGAQGASGYSGISGFSGTNGAQGAQGLKGSTGSTGAQGTSGYSGFTGVSGYSGFTGVSGFSGTNGTNGAQGATGATGAQGAQGFQGNQGATGTSGYSGLKGSTGSTGAQGAAGSNGAQGAAGSNGSNGAQGAQGATGSAGGTGAQGAQGATGAQGASGTSGFSGPGANQTLNTTSGVTFDSVTVTHYLVGHSGISIDDSGAYNNICVFYTGYGIGVGAGTVGGGYANSAQKATIDGSGNCTAVSFTTTSSRVNKTNIRPLTTVISSPLTITEQISGVIYDNIHDPEDTDNIGFIAEDVLPVLPYVVSTSATSAGEVATGIQYSRMIALLVETVKELNNKINELSAKVP